MTVSQITNNSIYSLGLYENKENKSNNYDFLSLLINAANNQASVSDISHLMMKEKPEPPDINKMSDSEFKDMLIRKHEFMKERGANAGGFPDPSMLSDEEISDLKVKMQERHEQKRDMMENGIMPHIPFLQRFDSSDTTQELIEAGGIQINLMQLLLNLMSNDSNNSDKNDWFTAAQFQNSLSSFVNTADYLSFRNLNQNRA